MASEKLYTVNLAEEGDMADVSLAGLLANEVNDAEILHKRLQLDGQASI
jgi:hypothetical protein